MAKGSAMGVWRGKKGTSVFYYLRNSNDAQKQGIRERVYKIANPQTNGQTDQRMKMMPLQRLGAMLGIIVRRSWQGVEYGGKTWQKFLKANLVNSKLPFVDKEDPRTIPGDILVSKGSLGSIELTAEDTDQWYMDVQLRSTDSNWASISESLIADNNLRNGDQLTLIRCNSNTRITEEMINADYIWKIDSLIVDTNSNLTVNDLLNTYQLQVKEDAGGTYRLNLVADQYESMPAAAVIVSRLSETGEYLRSTQRLAINENLLAEWFSNARHSAARRTYKRSTAAVTTNWPVDPDAEIAGTVPGSYTISGLTGDKASCNGKQCWVRRYEDNNELAAVYVTSWLGEAGDTLVNNANNQAMQYTSEQQALPLGASDVTALANLPQITWDGEPTS